MVSKKNISYTNEDYAFKIHFNFPCDKQPEKGLTIEMIVKDLIEASCFLNLNVLF